MKRERGHEIKNIRKTGRQPSGVVTPHTCETAQFLWNAVWCTSDFAKHGIVRVLSFLSLRMITYRKGKWHVCKCWGLRIRGAWQRLVTGEGCFDVYVVPAALICVETLYVNFPYSTSSFLDYAYLVVKLYWASSFFFKIDVPRPENLRFTVKSVNMWNAGSLGHEVRSTGTVVLGQHRGGSESWCRKRFYHFMHNHKV